MGMLMKKIMEEITLLGGILFYAIFSLWFLFKKDYDKFFMLILGLIIIYFLTLAIRLFYFKPRPKHAMYKNFIEKIDASSFPSVHSARATFLFVFLVIYFFNNLILIFLAFILMFFVFYSRIYLKKHDMTDVIGGIMLGILSFIVSLLFV